MPQLDRIITDPIISTENTAFTPLSAHPSTIERLPITSEVVFPSERDPLVGVPKPKKPFYRARPLWLVPFVLILSITRGMTLASSLEVITEISCRQVYEDYNHTPATIARDSYPSIRPQVDTSPSLVPLAFASLEESEGDGASEGDDPRVIPGKKCVSNPAVQARVVKLQTIMGTIGGVLSALTTGWWGQFSERYGRVRVLAIVTFSLFLRDLIFILVATPGNPLAAHSHKLLILAPTIEGLTGGWSSLTNAKSSYITDCTSPGSRATIFARFSGMLFVGLALGPIIGAWLIRNPIPFLKVGQPDHPLESVNSVFWVAITATFVNLLLVLTVFPESLPASRREMNRKHKHEDEARTSSNGRTWVVLRVIKSFFSPLAEFLPTDVPVAGPAGILNRPPARKDWSLTFLAFSLFIHTLSSGVFQIKYIYAEHIYGWGAEQLSYYVSYMGGVRACFLLALLPFILGTFKPVQTAVPSAVVAKPEPTKSHLFSLIQFDLLVVRCSMIVDFWSFALVALFPLPSNDPASIWRSQAMFVGATSLGCAGAGLMPAVQSLALCTLQVRKLAAKEERVRLHGNGHRASPEDDTAPESGNLFAAMSILQLISSSILAPITFATIYSETVAFYPKTVFAVAAVLVAAAIVLTLFVRPDVSLSVLEKDRGKRRSGAVPRSDLQDGSSVSSCGATIHDTNVRTERTGAGTSRHVI